MAPEQFKAMKLIDEHKHYEVGHFDDFEADIWGLGCLIYYVLTFTYPFLGKNLEDMMKLLSNPTLKVPDLPNVMKYEDKFYQDLKRIVAGCLKVNPEERMTAQEVLEEFHLLLAEAKVEPAPHSFFYTE
jgi:serine/threonine protein kinase